MGRKKKVIPIDVVKELGIRRTHEEKMELVTEHLTKFNTIAKAETLLWNINISRVSEKPQLYNKIYEHLKGFNYKNPLTVERLESLEAFILDYKTVN